MFGIFKSGNLLVVFLFLSPLFAQEKIRHPFDLGTATIQPGGPVAAGSFTSITFTYVTGHPVDESDFIKVAFRSIGDFGTPQFDRPAMPDFCTVYTTGDVRIEPRWEKPGIRPLLLDRRSSYKSGTDS